MANRSVKAALTFISTALVLFCGSMFALYGGTFGIERGYEYGELGVLILWPAIGLFSVLSVAAGLVTSHIVYRRASRSQAA